MAVLPVPSSVVAREREWLFQVGLDRGVDRDTDHMIEQVVTDSSNDVRRTNNLPLSPRLAAIGRENIFLGIIEVALRGDSGVGLKGWAGGWSYVESILLCSSLQEEPLWGKFGSLECPDEVLKETGCDTSVPESSLPFMREGLTIDPGQLIRIGPHVQNTALLGRLHVGEKENMVAKPTISVLAVLKA